MKVAQVCPLFPFYGGMETHVMEITKRLINSGIEVKIYATDPSRKLPLKDSIGELEIFRFRSYAPDGMYFLAPELYMALGKLKDVDVVHVHGYNTFPALAAALARSKNKRPLVFTPHYGGYDVHLLGTNTARTIAKKLYNHSVGKYVFHAVDAVITVGKIEKEFLKCKFGIEERKIQYIPNGVSAGRFERSLGRKTPTGTILYVGRLEKYKGVEFLISAFSKLRREFAGSKLVIVGGGSYKEKLVSSVRNSKVKDRVRFLEGISRSELIKLYLSSDLFVSLPQHETFGISMIEAMAYGMPVIATKVGEIPELVEPERTGFLVDFPPNESELIRAIEFLLENAELSVKMGLEARNSVLSRFSWDRTVQDLVKVYDRLS